MSVEASSASACHSPLLWKEGARDATSDSHEDGGAPVFSSVTSSGDKALVRLITASDGDPSATARLLSVSIHPRPFVGIASKPKALAWLMEGLMDGARHHITRLGEKPLFLEGEATATQVAGSARTRHGLAQGQADQFGLP